MEGSINGTGTTTSFMELSGFSSQGRWPRQETLTLLEIRMRLHPKFVQAATASKSPLWDEVSRIMAEEHGYQRSGKKCKEKLDNLYKYYKKTKGSGNNMNKGSTSDEKHYRFFNQLDTLYGQNHTTPPTTTILHQNPPHLIQTLNQKSIMIQPHNNLIIRSTSNSYSMSTESDSEDDYDNKDEVNITLREMINTQIKRLMEVQESGLAKMVRAIERLEQERVSREEAWRKEENVRLEREERLWAREHAWIGARDAALMDALNKISCRNNMCTKSTTRMEMMKEREVQVGEDNVESSNRSRGWGEEYYEIGGWVEEPEFHDEGLCRQQQLFP